ncbi:hypothetical protein JTE90_024826, partial [Oedothorax gibbosus]
METRFWSWKGRQLLEPVLQLAPLGARRSDKPLHRPTATQQPYPFPHFSFRNGNSGNELVWSACMEETGGLGVDLIVDNGVTLFSEGDFSRIMANDNYSYPAPPSKHEIISALAVGGRWITSKENLQ